MKIDDTHLVYVGGISEDPTIKIYRTVAYEKYKRGTGACAKNLYFQNGVLLSDERVKQIEGSIKAKRELKQSYDLQVSRSAKEMNLTQVYERDSFVGCQCQYYRCIWQLLRYCGYSYQGW